MGSLPEEEDLPSSQEEDTSENISDEESCTPTKKKKKCISKEDKKFLEFIKRYFSSISARRAVCVYFNVFPNKNKVVISNTDGPMMTNFSPGELSFHILEFKDNLSYLERLKTYLMVEDNDKIEIRNVTTWLSHINKHGLDNTVVWPCGTHDLTIISHLDMVDQAYEKKQIIGMRLKDFNIEYVLRSWMQYIETIDTKGFPMITVNVDRNADCEGCVLFEKVDLSYFVDKQGDRMFEDTMDLYVISFDGLSSPAVKEFVCKTEPPYTYKRKIWAEYPQYLRWMTVFEDTNVIVTSMRPHSGMYPMPKHTASLKES